MFVAVSLLLLVSVCRAQKFMTKEGKVSFYSKTALEDIEAHTKKALGVLDAAANTVEFSVLLKGFEFEKALMQEHFNENYVESDKFPKAVFKGTLKGVQWQTDGTYKTAVSGTLNLHGVTRAETAAANITVKGGVISGRAEMQVKPTDYAIKIPSLVGNKISETITITVVVDSFTPLNR